LTCVRHYGTEGASTTGDVLTVNLPLVAFIIRKN
jgi:hypothetical protein